MVTTSSYEADDVRAVPTYSVADAARYLSLPPATLRSWAVGRSYPRAGETAFFEPLIQLPDSPPTPGIYLSFANLIEAHALRALRTEHGLSIKAVRDALAFAQRSLGIDRLLLSVGLRTGARDLFLEHYGHLINLTKSGQLAMERVLESYLRRVEWDDSNQPLRLFPFLRGTHDIERRLIVIDPRVSFGRPVLRSKGVTTAIIADRIDAGESLEEVASDYELEISEIEEAVVYERAA